MKAVSSAAALKMQTNYKFNAGTNLESSFDVSYYETYFREYDAQIGRFTGIDPMGELTFSLSTYNFSTNNPILFNDPFGNFYKAPTSGHSFSEMVNIAIDNEFGEGSSMDFGLSEGGQGGGGENDEDGTAEGTASMTDVDFHFTGNKARDVFAALLNSYNNSDVDGNWSFSFGQDAQGHIGYWEWYNGNSSNYSSTGLREVIAGTRFVDINNNSPYPLNYKPIKYFYDFGVMRDSRNRSIYSMFVIFVNADPYVDYKTDEYGRTVVRKITIIDPWITYRLLSNTSAVATIRWFVHAEYIYSDGNRRSWNWQEQSIPLPVF